MGPFSVLEVLFALALLPHAVAAQTIGASLPDSITIEDNAWNLVRTYSDSYTLAREGQDYTVIRNSLSFAQGHRKKTSIHREVVRTVSDGAIRTLVQAVGDTGFSSLRLVDLGVDSSWVTHHSGRLFAMVKYKYDDWTARQVAFVKKELSDYSNYDDAAKRAILREGYYVIAKDYAVNFHMDFYYPGDSTVHVSAAENYLGLPWEVGNRSSFNPAIPRSIGTLVPKGRSGNVRRFARKDLMRVLAEEVFDDKCRDELPALAVLKYEDYMNDLKKDFTLLGASEAALDWGEYKNWPQSFRFTLRHPSLHEGIQLQLYAIRSGHSLYTADSLRKAFPALRDRLQGIQFLMDFLAGDSSRKINLFFFNNRGITRKRVDDFNKDLNHWKIHDTWVQDMERFKTRGIKPPFDVAESIKTSREVECGCDFRLDNTWLLQSILFELRDEYNHPSTWLLLPDNTPVLWYFQGEKVYKYSYRELGTTGRSVQWVCKKLDVNGNLIRERAAAP